MAPAKDKWTRRFIIPETSRHKKGFTIYKVTSMVFLNSSHEEVSKVSVWKRYNDFKKLHSELSSLHKRLGIKESFPTLPKSKYFGRFEAEVVEERRKYALKFLEFVGRHSYLYSSDIFITFFETSHVDDYASDCAHSLSSDTSEDDRIVALNNPTLAHDTVTQNVFQVPCISKTSNSVLTNPCPTLSNIIARSHTNETGFTVSRRKNESHDATNVQSTNTRKDEQSHKAKQYVQDTTAKDCNTHMRNKNLDSNNITNNESGFDCLNNNISNNLSNCNATRSTCSVMLHEKANLTQAQQDSTQYILIAAGHISAASNHESMAEYKEAFTQYKLGISCLITGVQLDPNSNRVTRIKEKISRYLERAEDLYNKHLNCNTSLISKSVSELQFYKVLKVMKSVMLVTDIRVNCSRIIKSVEKSSVHEDNINNYLLHEPVPHMVHLHACIETETTVFLILQYVSCGELWNFIRSRYKIPDSLISSQTCTNNLVSEEVHNNENVQELKQADVVVDNDKSWRRSRSRSIEEQSEIFCMEVPTTKLLEKSQKLLQSVNATLRRSNSIASRLNKSKELTYSGNTLSRNIKSVTRISNFDLKKENDTGNSPNEVNLSNIDYDVHVNNGLMSDKDCNIDETQHLSNENNVDEEQELLWQVPESIIRSWAAEILSALEALHQQNVIIFDFKPENILVDDKNHIQLTYVTPRRNTVEMSRLTYPYSSPESVTFAPTILVTPATDIWSFGVILYELLTGIAFIAKHPGLFHSHSVVSIPNKLSENARSLLHGMLKYYPDERLTLDEIKCHPFFAEIDWSNIVNSQT